MQNKVLNMAFNEFDTLLTSATALAEPDSNSSVPKSIHFNFSQQIKANPPLKNSIPKVEVN